MIKQRTLILLLALVASPILAQAPESENSRQMPQQMQERMHTMQEQMARMHETTDPAERQRLMQEHMQSMHEGMMMMGEMMRGGMSGGRMQQCQSGDNECQMSQMQMRLQMMGQQMGMMQQMMMQMMEHMMQGQGMPSGGADSEHHNDGH